MVDSDGNDYYEVDYLSQDIVFKEVSNNNFKNDNVPSIIKPYLVSRKFVVERDRNNTYLQFGSGKSGETNVVADPQNVALDIYGKSYVTDITFDPTRLTRNENFGIVPSNTTLTVVYRTNNAANSNVAVGALNQVATAEMDFANKAQLVSSTTQTVINSLEVTNETPIVGDVSTTTSSELKRRIYDTFPTQNRAVTQADDENVVYRMPGKFGSVKRVSVQRDPDSLKRNLNMYLISQDRYNKLIKANSTIKKNVKTWINHYRMINDTVDILDPYIVNLGIEFVVKAQIGVDKFEVLNSCVNSLKAMYADPFFIGESIRITNIYRELNQVRGVLDVVKVKLINKTGANYADTVLDINKNLSPDGTYLAVPKNVIVEIKFPQTDIRGKVR